MLIVDAQKPLIALGSLILGGLLMAAAPVPPTPDGEITAKYKISFINIDMARANLAAKLEHGLYTVRVGYKTTGIVKLFATASGDVVASGSLESGKPAPSAFVQTARENSKDSKVNLAISDGAITSVEATPPLSPDPNRVPVGDAAKKNVIDPLSALLMPIAKPKEPGKDALAASCDRTIPIFDGWSRYDIKLSLKEVKTVDKAGFKGQAVICSVRWVPVAGHIPDRKGTKFMAENKDIDVMLAPAGTSGFLIPLHIGVQTLRGHIDVDATEFSAKIVMPPAE
ncbi:MAG: DUF3108 domain-containing protein [Ancalomicrobiaceae bacterium]|nr:DUF3108 domain-containing protein [Ancalomicrobiaceae bacterium]